MEVERGGWISELSENKIYINQHNHICLSPFKISKSHQLYTRRHLAHHIISNIRSFKMQFSNIHVLAILAADLQFQLSLAMPNNLKAVAEVEGHGGCKATYPACAGGHIVGPTHCRCGGQIEPCDLWWCPSEPSIVSLFLILSPPTELTSNKIQPLILSFQCTECLRAAEHRMHLDLSGTSPSSILQPFEVSWEEYGVCCGARYWDTVTKNYWVTKQCRWLGGLFSSVGWNQARDISTRLYLSEIISIHKIQSVLLQKHQISWINRYNCAFKVRDKGSCGTRSPLF